MRMPNFRRETDDDSSGIEEPEIVLVSIDDRTTPELVGKLIEDDRNVATGVGDLASVALVLRSFRVRKGEVVVGGHATSDELL